MRHTTNSERKRVSVKDYGTIRKEHPALVPLRGDVRVHVLAAPLFSMWLADVEATAGTKLKVVSGHREPRFDSLEAYERYCVKVYGSVEEGRKWLAFQSPHQTGLALDVVWDDWRTSRTMAADMAKTHVFGVMKRLAPRYGLVNYEPEPWHWEAVEVTPDAWRAANARAERKV